MHRDFWAHHPRQGDVFNRVTLTAIHGYVIDGGVFMDIGLIATSTVSFLVPYLTRLGRKVASGIGEDLSGFAEDKIKALYESIKEKLKGDDYASKTLERLEEVPGDAIRQQTMQGILQESLKEDENFSKKLQQLLEEVNAAGGGVIQTGNGVVANNHSVAAGHGGNAAGRDNNITTK